MIHVKLFEEFINEKKKYKKDLKNACWAGYKAVGLKKKNGKMVPNCIPETNESFEEHDLVISKKDNRQGTIVHIYPNGKVYEVEFPNNEIEQFNEEEIEKIEESFEFEEVYEGKASDVERTKNGITYRGEHFPGFNKPKKYSGSGKFKKRVLAKEVDEIKVLNYGHRDYQDYTQHKDADRRKKFRSRMNCDPVSSLSKLTKRYWACQDLW